VQITKIHKAYGKTIQVDTSALVSSASTISFLTHSLPISCFFLVNHASSFHQIHSCISSLFLFFMCPYHLSKLSSTLWFINFFTPHILHTTFLVLSILRTPHALLTWSNSTALALDFSYSYHNKFHIHTLTLPPWATLFPGAVNKYSDFLSPYLNTVSVFEKKMLFLLSYGSVLYIWQSPPHIPHVSV